MAIQRVWLVKRLVHPLLPTTARPSKEQYLQKEEPTRVSCYTHVLRVSISPPLFIPSLPYSQICGFYDFYLILNPMFDFLEGRTCLIYHFSLYLPYLVVPGNLNTQRERNVRVMFVTNKQLFSTKYLAVIFLFLPWLQTRQIILLYPMICNPRGGAHPLV